MKTTFTHGQQSSTGILITNLGTPDSTSTSSVRRYLAEFLWDVRVIDKPRALWWLILHGVILRLRPAKVAKNYAKIWSAEGSPLLAISKQQREKLYEMLQKSFNHPIHVELAMRYGSPSIKNALENLQDKNIERLIVLPLYPQFSATTTASTFDAIAEVFKNWQYLPETRFIQHYHDKPEYISALASSIRAFQKDHGQPDKLLLSFHSLPERYLHAGDPYFCECHKTARLLAETLELADDDWEITFQSRFGPEKWLGPYTDETLENWGKEGVRFVQVACPGFAADCLETLEEIAMQNRDNFLHAGGKRFEYIPALNAEYSHIEMMADLVTTTCQDWLEISPTASEDNKASTKHAKALGAQN